VSGSANGLTIGSGVVVKIKAELSLGYFENDERDIQLLKVLRGPLHDLSSREKVVYPNHGVGTIENISHAPSASSQSILPPALFYNS